MKKLSITTLLLMMTLLTVAQRTMKYQYQVIVLETDYDRHTEKSFVRILSEPGLVTFPEFTRLVPYSEKRLVVNEPSTFFTGQTDTTISYYNFFLNSTQALGYLAMNDWELITVLSNTRGDDSRITTQPLYYFRKEIRPN